MTRPSDRAIRPTSCTAVGRSTIFPTRPLTGLLGFLGRQSNLVPDTGLRRLLGEHLRFQRLEDAPVPFHVVAADVVSGEAVLLSRGDAIDAILASAAIPAIFPTVRVEGRDLIDGGVVNNTPISHAVGLGADTVWVLSTGFACALPSAPQGALAMALHSLTLMVNQRLAVDIERYEPLVDLRVVPPLCPIRVSPSDFSGSAQLIDRAHRATAAWLQSRHAATGQAVLLEPHRHVSREDDGFVSET